MSEELKPCPFCGKQPQFGLTKKTGCQMHGDPIQNVTLSCGNPYCHAKPCVTGGDRYSSGYEKGAKFKECEQRAKDLAVKYWSGNTRTEALTQPKSSPIQELQEMAQEDGDYDLSKPDERIGKIETLNEDGLYGHLLEFADNISSIVNKSKSEWGSNPQGLKDMRSSVVKLNKEALTEPVVNSETQSTDHKDTCEQLGVHKPDDVVDAWRYVDTICKGNDGYKGALGKNLRVLKAALSNTIQRGGDDE